MHAPRTYSTAFGAGFLHGDVATLILLWLTGVYLRLTILVAPPLAPMIGQELHLSQAGMGALTTLPTLLLAAGAIPGSFVTAKLGARRTLILALILTGAGSALRGAGGTAGLFTATFGMGVGIAAMQPALPALVHRWCPAAIGLATAVYTNGLLSGEIIGSGLTLPAVLPLAHGSWRLCLTVWSLPALVVALGLFLRPSQQSRETENGQARLWWPNWRSKEVWILGFALGGSSIIYFGTNAYTPNLMHARGEAELISAALISLNGSQLFSSALVMLRPQRFVGRRTPLVGMGLLAVAGMLGAVLGTGWVTVACVGVVGFSCSFVMVLSLALPPVLGGAERTASLAAGMFTVSYVCSFVIPLAGGVAWDMTGTPLLAFLPLAVFSAVTAVLPVWLPLQGAES